MGRHGEQANEVINPFDAAGIVGVPVIDTDLLQQYDAGITEPLSLVDGNETTTLPPGILLLDGPSGITEQRGVADQAEPQRPPRVLGYVKLNGQPHLYTATEGGMRAMPRVVRQRLARLVEAAQSTDPGVAVGADSDAIGAMWREWYPERVLKTSDLEGINARQNTEEAEEVERIRELHAAEQRRVMLADRYASSARVDILTHATQIRRDRE